MASTNSNTATPEGPNSAATAETENVNSTCEYREALWEPSIRPMRSPKLAQIRPEGDGQLSGIGNTSLTKLGGPPEGQTT